MIPDFTYGASERFFFFCRRGLLRGMNGGLEGGKTFVLGFLRLYLYLSCLSFISRVLWWWGR